MKNTKVPISILKTGIGITELDFISYEEKMRILNEAYLGKRDLATILSENKVSEETFYLWKIAYLNSPF